MKKQDNIISLNSLHYFNAHTRSAEDVVNTFIARRKVLKELEEGIASEKPESIPQHYMIIGSRGMGKSTLLRRLEISLRSGKLKEGFVPILFPEEQYNIDRLSKFWLNSLDALADSLEVEQKYDQAFVLDTKINTVSKIENEQRRSEAAYSAMRDVCKQMDRRPVFLVDNIDILFAGISADEQFKLREIITGNAAPIFVAASTQNPNESQDYDAAFYDAFDNIYLERLTQQEMRELLLYLAEKTGQSRKFDEIYEKTGQLDALHNLTGGNPRIAVFIFQLISNGLSERIFENLNSLLDVITPLYKSNFEQLSKQGQLIVDALALHWDPCDLDTLSQLTKLANNQLSAQIERLVKQGWIERGNRYSLSKGKVMNKIKNYQIRERFFNIWYIMRRATRRQRGDLKSLTCFLETFYTPQHLELEKKRVIELIKENLDSDKVIYGLALSKAYLDGASNDMEEEIYREILTKTQGNLLEVSKYTDPDVIPNHIMATYMGETTQWIDYVQDLLEKEDYAKLQEVLLHLLSMDKFSNDGYAWSKLGQAYFGAKEYEKSEEAYLKSLSLRERSITYVWLGTLYEAKGQILDAKKAYENGMKAGDDPYYQVRFANFLIDNGDKKKAEQLLLDVVERNPEYVYGLVTLSFEYIKTQRHSLAIPTLEQAIKFDPNDAMLWDLLGRCQWILGDSDAQQSFFKALSLKPESASYWFRYAGYLEAQDDFSGSETAYLKALEFDKSNLTYIESYAKFLFTKSSDYSRSKEFLTKALETVSSDLLSVLLGSVYVLLKDIQIGQNIFKSVIKSNTGYSPAYASLAYLQHFELDQYDQAKKNYSKAIKLQPNQPEVLHLYGQLLHYCLKDYREAENLYARAFAYKNYQAKVVFDLVTLLRDQLGDYVQALDIFEKQENLQRVDPVNYWIQKALFSQYRGNLGDAKQAWLTSLKLIDDTITPQELEPLWRAMATTFKLGQSESLVSIFEESESDRTLRPIYEGFKALSQGSQDYLMNIAPEVADAALQIFRKMDDYLNSDKIV